MKTKAHYSGKGSERFWKRVNALKDKEWMWAVYTAGCILQTVERYVLQQLENGEAMSKKVKG
jgi:hypothetical protein